MKNQHSYSHLNETYLAPLFAINPYLAGNEYFKKQTSLSMLPRISFNFLEFPRISRKENGEIDASSYFLFLRPL